MTKQCGRCGEIREHYTFVGQDGCVAVNGACVDCRKNYARSETPEHASWRAMLGRCTDPRHTAFVNYGGRGIKVCDRWRSFDAFLADMGPRPEGLTLDRMDNEGNYEPGNCRWATRVEQSANARPRRSHFHEGVLARMRELRAAGLSTRAIALAVGASWHAVERHAPRRPVVSP